MSLETGNRIADLVPTNPVGATDFVSQGDDHIRLIKACIQGSFPSLGSTAVARTAEELNGIKDASNLTSGTLPDGRFPATLPAASGVNLTALVATNISSGTLADGRLSSNVPLKDAANTFTATQTMTVAGAAAGYFSSAGSVSLQITGGNSGTGAAAQFTDGQSGTRSYQVGVGILGAGGNFSIYDVTATATRLNISAAGNATLNAPDSGPALTVNGVGGARVAEFSVAGQPAILGLVSTGGTGRSWSIYSHSNGNFYLTDSTAGIDPVSVFGSTGGINFGSPTGGDKGAGTLNTAGAIYQNNVAVPALPAVTSTSTTLAAGQAHYITGNATLPALSAGEWVSIINNSGSAITISESSGYTTYWTASGASVSSVTLAARGRLFAEGVGSSVAYVSGDITGSA